MVSFWLQSSSSSLVSMFSMLESWGAYNKSSKAAPDLCSCFFVFQRHRNVMLFISLRSGRNEKNWTVPADLSLDELASSFWMEKIGQHRHCPEARNWQERRSRLRLHLAEQVPTELRSGGSQEFCQDFHIPTITLPPPFSACQFFSSWQARNGF